jgi:hypothetical protein
VLGPMSTIPDMVRVFVILLLATGWLAQAGVRPVAVQHGDCGHAVCITPAIETSCCGEPAASDSYCPMTGGACTCKASPAPDKQPDRDAPLPRFERDGQTAVRAPPTGIETAVKPEAEPLRSSGVTASLLSGLTHNEIQALLSIWRT